MFLTSILAFDMATSVPWYDLPITFETNSDEIATKNEKLD
jgi:hypothetical protein